MEPVPVTVLTGFLGSGKTTLLNHILTESHGHRIGVLINEFGEISIDGRLIASRDDNILELANGCVCCTVRDDLLRSVATLLERPQPPEHIVIETSGLADPVPVAGQLLDPRVQGDIRLDSIITLVDALNFDRNLDYAEQAYNQITTGDILLINKIDLVPDQVAEAIETGVRRLNPSARLLRCAHARVDIGLILGLRLFKPTALAVKNDHEVGARDADRHEHPRSGGHEHSHTDGHEPDAFRALSIRRPASVNLTRLAGVLDAIPAGIFRGKGVLSVAGAATRLIVHLVGGRWTVVAGDAWPPDEARLTEMVFIGKDLSPAEWAAVEGQINASFED